MIVLYAAKTHNIEDMEYFCWPMVESKGFK